MVPAGSIGRNVCGSTPTWRCLAPVTPICLPVEFLYISYMYAGPVSFQFVYVCWPSYIAVCMFAGSRAFSVKLVHFENKANTHFKYLNLNQRDRTWPKTKIEQFRTCTSQNKYHVS